MDSYLRCFLIHVARAVLRNVAYNCDFKFDCRIQWTAKLVDRVSYNNATVVLANNLGSATKLLGLRYKTDTTFLKDRQPENLAILRVNRDP